MKLPNTRSAAFLAVTSGSHMNCEAPMGLEGHSLKKRAELPATPAIGPNLSVTVNIQ